MTWHVDGALLAGYADGTLSRSRLSSVEAHLVACADCRAAVAPLVDQRRLDRNWSAITTLVDQRVRHWPERLLIRCGMSDRLVRLVMVTPGARDPWLVAMAVVLLLSTTFETFGGSPRGDFLFLVAAPLLPLAGVAAAFASREDPARELVAVTPTAGLELLLARSAAVVVPAFLITAVLAVSMPGAGWSGAVWLLPSLGLTAATMALASWFPARAVAAVIAVMWTGGAGLSVRGAAGNSELIERFVAFRPVGQAMLAVAAVAATAVLLLRRERFEMGGIA